MRCDKMMFAANELPIMFQSLLGFLMRCDGWSFAS